MEGRQGTSLANSMGADSSKLFWACPKDFFLQATWKRDIRLGMVEFFSGNKK